MTVKKPTSFHGIDHVKLPSSDIRKTAAFYTDILPFTPAPQWDHRTPDGELFAVMFTHEPTGLVVEVRKHDDHAEAQRGWDPITWSVNSRNDLEEWAAWFDENKVRHSKVLTGLKGWVLGAEDPDGKIIRLYTKEEHEWTTEVDKGMSGHMIAVFKDRKGRF
jgi:catechol 2,3-dioxygenase-like lactoylglutathione lyase family enzyme